MDIYCKDGWALVLRNALGPAGQLFTTNAVNTLTQGPTQNTNYKVSDAVWQALISPCGDGTMATDYSKKNYFATTGLDCCIDSGASLCSNVSPNPFATTYLCLLHIGSILFSRTKPYRLHNLKQELSNLLLHISPMCQCQVRRPIGAVPKERGCISARALLTTSGSAAPTVPATVW